MTNLVAVFFKFRLMFTRTGTQLSLCLPSISLLQIVARYKIKFFLILFCYGIKVVLKPHRAILNLFQSPIKKIRYCICRDPCHYSFIQYHLKTLRSDILWRPGDSSVPRRETSKSRWQKQPKKPALPEYCSRSGHSSPRVLTKLLRAKRNWSVNCVLETWDINFYGVNVRNREDGIHLFYE